MLQKFRIFVPISFLEIINLEINNKLCSNQDNTIERMKVMEVKRHLIKTLPKRLVHGYKYSTLACFQYASIYYYIRE